MRLKRRIRALVTWALVSAIVVPAVAIPVIAQIPPEPVRYEFVAVYGTMYYYQLPLVMGGRNAAR